MIEVINSILHRPRDARIPLRSHKHIRIILSNLGAPIFAVLMLELTLCGNLGGENGFVEERKVEGGNVDEGECWGGRGRGDGRGGEDGLD